jgi:hypothetical protein
MRARPQALDTRKDTSLTNDKQSSDGIRASNGEDEPIDGLFLLQDHRLRPATQRDLRAAGYVKLALGETTAPVDA